MKKLGMVIINYNDFETTQKLIDNVKTYNSIDKIVIVDNCSTDDSYNILKKIENDKINIIKTDKNKGYAYGLNYGAKYLINELKDVIIIFSNSDIIIKKEEDLIALKDNINGEIKVVGPVIEEHHSYNRGWKSTTPFIETLCNLPVIYKHFKKKYLNYKDDYYNSAISFVDVISGCFFLVDGQTLQKINYFDENTFLYYEEFILSSKIKKINKKIIVNNKVHIIHNHSISIDKSVNRINKYKILKESQRYYVENYLKANKLQLFFLYITNKIELFLICISCIFKKS